MQLAIIRHAIAAEASGALGDAERPLTPAGRARFEAVVRGLVALELRFERVVHSPLLRAVQTAELLTPCLHGESRASTHLTNAPSQALLDELIGESVAVVGHEPWVSELVAWLVTSQRELGASFAMKKGGVAVLEGRPRPGAMALLGFYPPRALAGPKR